MKISKEDLMAIKKTGESIFLNEVQSYYLLGNTNEYDKFEPTKLNLNECSDFDKYKYACCLYAGYKIIEDEEKAYKIWQELAKKGQAESLIEYSVYLFKNNAQAEAFECLQQSATSGNTLAQFRIGLCYMFGFGIEQNEKKAFAIFEKLSQSDYPNAVYMLGSFYMSDNGVIVQRDITKGWDLIKKAAKLGSPFAQYEVAIQLCATSQNNVFTQEVITLLTSSADNGDLRAQYLLALAYAKGEGVEVNLEKSMNYLAQSFEGGFPLAIDLMKKIKESLKEE